ncbi:hypothetical protein D3C76_887610 [compost metagenome]
MGRGQHRGVPGPADHQPGCQCHCRGHRGQDQGPDLHPRGRLPGRDRQLPLAAQLAGGVRAAERQPGRAPGAGLCSARHLHRLHQPVLCQPRHRPGLPLAEPARQIAVAARSGTRPGPEVHLRPRRLQPPHPGSRLVPVSQAEPHRRHHAQLAPADQHAYRRRRLRAGQRHEAVQPDPVLAVQRAPRAGCGQQRRCRCAPEELLQRNPRHLRRAARHPQRHGRPVPGPHRFG